MDPLLKGLRRNARSKAGTWTEIASFIILAFTATTTGWGDWLQSTMITSLVFTLATVASLRMVNTYPILVISKDGEVWIETSNQTRMRLLASLLTFSASLLALAAISHGQDFGGTSVLVSVGLLLLMLLRSQLFLRIGACRLDERRLVPDLDWPCYMKNDRQVIDLNKSDTIIGLR